MNSIKKILILLLIALALLQFYRPEKNAATYRAISAFEADTNPSKEVVAILKARCYDCHTNKTTYPWYAEISPVSLWMQHHVEEANEHLNLSKWSMYTAAKKDHKLDELIEEVEEEEMPLKSYTWMHGSLTEKEKEALISWAKKARENYTLD